MRWATGVKANARERAQAAAQIPLWLVVRGAGRQTDPALRAYAARFAARALEAARRQDDRVWLLAMLREQGESAFDRNDKKGAAAIWSRMLELVVTPPEARARRPAGGNRAGGPGLREPGRLGRRDRDCMRGDSMDGRSSDRSSS